MKFTNFLFILSLLITFSYQEKVMEQVQEQTEENSEAELLNTAELQLGSQEESQIETESVEEIKDESGLVLSFKQDYLVGDWLMYGYGCNRRTPKVEKCNCKMQGAVAICTKTLGDDCVTTGHETFRTKNLPNKLFPGKNLSITYVVGNARRPNSGHWRNSMHIVNYHEFRSQKRRYVRIAPKPAVNPMVKPVAPTIKPIPAPGSIPIKIPIAIPSRPIPVPRPAPRPAVPAQRMVYYYSNYFLGNWNGVGYSCDAATPQIEVVNIRYYRGNLYATKLLGDNCVPAKKLSFEAPIPGRLWQGLSFGCKFVVGSPQHPAARQIPNSIKIIDLNTFEVGKHTFYRVMGPNAAHPHGVYLNMTPLVGHSAYPGPGFIKMNPKKNMRSPVRRFVIVEEETNKPGNC